MKSEITGKIVYKAKEDSKNAVRFLNRFKIKHKMENNTLHIDDKIYVCRFTFNKIKFQNDLIHYIGKCESKQINISEPYNELELAQLLDENLLD